VVLEILAEMLETYKYLGSLSTTKKQGDGA
jgi:hypothetical protein